MAQFVTQEHSRKYVRKFSLASEAVLEETYMDDTITSVVDEKVGIQLHKELTLLWGSGMFVRKWLSNSIEVLKITPENDRAEHSNLDSGELPEIKTFGVVWKAKLIYLVLFCYNRRKFELWINGNEWDDAIPDRIANNLGQWFQELNDLPKINILRSYGAVAYQQCLYDTGEVTCVIIMSKARVSLLQSISIPRLELLGAVLGLRLAEKIVKALKLESKDVTIWCVVLMFYADLLTRGTTVKELENNYVWWHGPSFLNSSEKKWSQNHIAVTQETSIEVNKNTVLMSFALSTEVTKQMLDINKFSCWKKTYQVKRLDPSVYRQFETDFRKKSDIAADKYHETEKEIIAKAQKESFKEEYSNIEK
ncbi:uncharacterized protein LOC136096690 [Hydra vulgaris]|uniref:uncharacterized protein LOC136096690 n=1 Tax=Hydra vulgaris TaxID=6087 RepID=UPI0032EA20D2